MLINSIDTRFMRCLLVFSLLSLSGHSLADSPVEKSMETMQKAYKKALKSQSIKEFSIYFNTLQKSADQASQLRFGKTKAAQATYKDGLHELQADLADIQDAIHRQDLNKAKDLLSAQVNQTRKTYHKDLKVGEDEDENKDDSKREDDHEAGKQEKERD